MILCLIIKCSYLNLRWSDCFYLNYDHALFKPFSMFENNLWLKCVGGQPHLVMHTSVLMATKRLSCFQMQQLGSQSDALAGPDSGRSGTKSSHSLRPWKISRGTRKKCARSFYRNSLWKLFGCIRDLLQLVQKKKDPPPCGFSWAFSQTLRSRISTWTMFLLTAWKVIACTSHVSQMNFTFHHVLLLAHSFLAWSEVWKECLS